MVLCLILCFLCFICFRIGKKQSKWMIISFFFPLSFHVRIGRGREVEPNKGMVWFCVNFFLFLLLTFLASMIFVSMFWGSTEKERERKEWMNWILFVFLLYLGYRFLFLKKKKNEKKKRKKEKRLPLYEGRL